MIALTLVSLLLLSILLAQHLLAPRSARRLAHRRLRASGRTITPAAGAELEQALTRRTRVASAGGTAGIVVATTVLWLVLRDPNGVPGLLPVAIVLAATVLGSVLAEVADVARTTATVPAGVRVAGLQARDPHLTPRERLAESAFVALALLALVLTTAAWATGVDRGATATVCSAAAVLTIAVSAGTRRWLLQQPAPADDSDRAVVAELVTTATADRFTENLVANGAVLLLYTMIVLGPHLDGLASLATLGLVLLTCTTIAIASRERTRARKGVAA